MDNSTNTHIFNDEKISVGKLHGMYISGVAKFGRAGFKPTELVTVKRYWKDYEGNSHTHRF